MPTRAAKERGRTLTLKLTVEMGCMHNLCLRGRESKREGTCTRHLLLRGKERARAREQEFKSLEQCQIENLQLSRALLFLTD